MAPRIPKEADFASLQPNLHVSVSFPDPPESTTTFLILLHGFGGNEAPFLSFARGMRLPGVLSIAVRGTSPLPPSLLPDEQAPALGGGAAHFHWGDDVTMDPSTGDIADDPGFAKSSSMVLDELIRGLIITKLGWEMDDVILFGFGQGGSLALGLASQISNPPRIEDASSASDERTRKDTLKGVVSIGGGLPPSVVSTLSSRKKAKTRALLVQVSGGDVDYAKGEFESARTVEWKRAGVDMPRNRDEMFPIMQFLAEALSRPHTFGG